MDGINNQEARTGIFFGQQGEGVRLPNTLEDQWSHLTNETDDDVHPNKIGDSAMVTFSMECIPN
jgi:hypothetical protein